MCSSRPLGGPGGGDHSSPLARRIALRKAVWAELEALSLAIAEAGMHGNGCQQQGRGVDMAQIVQTGMRKRIARFDAD